MKGFSEPEDHEKGCRNRFNAGNHAGFYCAAAGDAGHIHTEGQNCAENYDDCKSGSTSGIVNNGGLPDSAEKAQNDAADEHTETGDGDAAEFFRQADRKQRIEHQGKSGADSPEKCPGRDHHGVYISVGSDKKSAAKSQNNGGGLFFTRKFSCCKAADNHNQYRADILKDCSRSRIGIGDCFHISQLTHHNAGNGKNKKTKRSASAPPDCRHILSVGKKTEAGEDKTGREEPCGCQIGGVSAETIKNILSAGSGKSP